MQDPFGEKRGRFEYAALKLRLDKIKRRLDEKLGDKLSDLDSDMSTSDTDPNNEQSNS
ncbi:ubiquitin-conjugating enzyme E2 Z-like [Saccoglossus kowalevskii]